jgi:lysophospholipase L1-like esterase
MERLEAMADIGSFVALGDSFTEGVGDPYPDGICRGWADQVARRLAAGSPTFGYANLAVRGKLLGQVIEAQVPAAVELQPDLVSIVAGGNDLLRPKADPDALAARLDEAIASLRTAGSQVLMFTGFDPAGVPLLRLVSPKVAAYNERLREIAARHDCLLTEVASMRQLADPREWCADRLHLSPDGHRRVALAACEVLGIPVDEDWREPLPPLAESGWLAARRQDMKWARAHVMPWIGRRLRGVSSGDDLLPKRPQLLPVDV